MAINRAITVNNLLSMKFKEMEFDGIWKKAIGIPEMSGVWIVWGNSGNGKTTFMLQMAKYLTKFGKVAYDTLEEGTRKTMRLAALRVGLGEVSRRLIFLNRESIEELKIRLRKKRSPQIIIIDSYQYTGLTKPQYIALKEEFSDKLFIFVSHAEGKNPEGRPAKFVRYDADVKIRVEGFRAFPISRYGGGGHLDIWEEKAAIYHNEVE